MSDGVDEDLQATQLGGVGGHFRVSAFFGIDENNVIGASELEGFNAAHSSDYGNQLFLTDIGVEFKEVGPELSPSE